MAKVEDPKLPGGEAPPLGPQGPGTKPSFFRQLSLLHIMISLVYFAVLFWAMRRIMDSNGYAEWIILGVLVGLGVCSIGLWGAMKWTRLSFIGWIIFVVGYMTIAIATTTIFAIPALPILIASIIFMGFRRRSNNQDALLWVLAVAAERRMPMGPGVQAFSSQVSGMYHVWASSLADLLWRGVPLPDALDSMPRLVPRKSSLLIRTGWESGDLGLGLNDAVAARSTSQPVLHFIGGQIAYLGGVTAVCLGIVGFVMYFIIPKYEAIFKDFGVDLPVMTKLVIQTSHLAVDYSWVLMLGTLGALIYGMIVVLGPGELSLPLIDRFFARRHVNLILRSLAIVVAAGRPIPPALYALAQWYPAAWVRRKLALAATDSSQGVEWIAALRENGLLSSSDVGVLSSAQRAGNLSWALRELAETGERRWTYRLQAWSQLVFIVAMLVIGGLVFVLAVAFFMPLVQLIERLAS